MTRFVLPLTGLLFLGGLLLYAAQSTFAGIAYPGQKTPESRIESLNYAVQTITTVGYGNWESPALGKTLTGQQKLDLREVSIYFMSAGGIWFAIFTGIVVAAMTPKDKRPPSAP